MQLLAQGTNVLSSYKVVHPAASVPDVVATSADFAEVISLAPCDACVSWYQMAPRYDLPQLVDHL
jgi:hypothetical protein